ncbi:hypothetical protein BRM33_13105, partial [Xanthomonas oryzae pv. oryzae]
MKPPSSATATANSSWRKVGMQSRKTMAVVKTMHWKDAGRLPTLRTFLDQAIAMRTEPSTHPPLPRRLVLLMAAAT